MKASVRVISALVGLLVMASSLSACGGGQPKSSGSSTESGKVAKVEKSDGKIPTIRFTTGWMSEPGFKDTEFPKVVNKFIEDNKDNFKFEIEDVNGADARTKIKTDVAAGNMPDIFGYWPGGALKDFVDNKLLLNVKDYFSESKNVKYEDFDEDALKSFSIDNGQNIYGFPQEGLIAYYLASKSIFQKYNLEYPKTLDDLYKVSKVLKQNGVVPIAVGAKGGNPAHFFYGQILYKFCNAEDMLNLPKTKNFDVPGTKKAAEVVVDMVNNGVFPDDTMANGDFAPAVALYNEGKAAMIMSFPWMMGSFKPEVIKDSVVIPYPQLPGETNTQNFTLGGILYGLVASDKSFKDPAKHEAMVAALDMLLSDEAFKGVVQSGRVIPKKSLKIDPAWANPLYVKVSEFYKDYKQYPMIWGQMPDPASQEVFSLAIDELWAKAITPDEFVKKVSDSVKAGN